MKKQKQGAPNTPTLYVDADSIQTHARTAAEQLATTLRSLEAAGENLMGAIPAYEDGPDSWSHTAALLEPVGRQLLFIACGVLEKATFYDALAKVARASVPAE